MKILAIRGGNLASLHGKFELDFTTAPLLGCGLFTINGETGAGKSTILDAMCLALYGRFPRITSDGPRDKVANSLGEEIQNSDPRSILRTGCASAFAEVDLMIEGRTLRASWQVRRARGRAEGNLLAFERSLVDLKDGAVLASGKKQVEEEITRRLKLTYEQFGRTVLLAQNEFDAFLRATDRDRADLLEKITGTELYSNISVLTFEREREARRKLDELQQQTGFIKVLPEDERRQLQRLVEASKQSQAKLHEKEKKVVLALSWYERRAEARLRLAEAQQEEEVATRDLEAAGEQRKLLAQMDRVTRLQPVVERAERAGQLWTSLQDDLARRKAEKADLRTRLEKSEKQKQQAETRFQAAKKELSGVMPLLEQAQKLDVQISTVSDQRGEVQKALQGAENRYEELHKKKHKQESARARLQERLARLDNSLDEMTSLRIVAQRAGDIGKAFAHLKQVQTELGRAGGDLAGKKMRYEELRQSLAQDRNASEADRERLAKQRQRLDENAQLLTRMKPDELRLKRDLQLDYQNRLTLLDQHLDALLDQNGLIEKAGNALKQANEKREAAAGDLARLERDLEELRSRALEADELLSRSKTVLSKQVLELRAALKEGEPCVVCGSTDHPGHDDEAAALLLKQMKARTAELAHELASGEKKRMQLQKDLERAGVRGENAQERLDHAKADLKRLQGRTTALYANLREAASPLDLKIVRKKSLAQQSEYVRELLEATEHHRVDMRKRLMAVQQLEAEHGSLRAQVLALEQGLKTQLAEQQQRAREEEEAQDELAGAVKHHQLLSGRADLVLDQILNLLGGLDVSRADLQRDPAASERFVEKEIARFETTRVKAQELRAELVELRQQKAVLHEQLAQGRARIEELNGELERLDTDLAQQEKARTALFEGEPVAKVRERVQRQFEAARQDREEGANRIREISTRLEELEKTTTRLHASVQKAREEKEKTLASREAALAREEMELADYHELCAKPEQEVQALRRRMDRLSTRQATAKARLIDHEAHLARIESQPSPGETPEQLQAVLQEIEADRAMLMIDLGKNNSLLELDDEGRRQRAALQGKIEKLEREHELWAVMSGAIGSRHGDRFRRFAQGVTLDHLIALANLQLRTINPRYEIERNAIGGLGLQVVDRDMGGEIRSVRSLSGGERFLVSLALALALSRLDGRSSFVDTLMIDEGFGALDARSLDIVIEALESLQSQGRKVGVISHIEALTDRIPVQVKVEKQGNGRSHVRVVEQGIG